jgi:hypothetical protein
MLVLLLVVVPVTGIPSISRYVTHRSDAITLVISRTDDIAADLPPPPPITPTRLYIWIDTVESISRYVPTEAMLLLSSSAVRMILPRMNDVVPVVVIPNVGHAVPIEASRIWRNDIQTYLACTDNNVQTSLVSSKMSGQCAKS